MIRFFVRRWRGMLVALMVLVLDVLSKAWVLGNVPPHRWWVEGQLGLVLAWNRGMSFSLLQDVVWGPWLLAAVAVVACVMFVRWMGEQVGWGHQGGLGLIVGGALGNLCDRVQHGEVVDFVVVNPAGWFPYTFNVADACITVGVVVLLGIEVLKVFAKKGA